LEMPKKEKRKKLMEAAQEEQGEIAEEPNKIKKNKCKQKVAQAEADEKVKDTEEPQRRKKKSSSC